MKKNVVDFPQKVSLKNDAKIAHVYAGYDHSMAIGINHEVFVWGDGSKGQLGRDSKMSNKPIQVVELINYYVNNG